VDIDLYADESGDLWFGPKGSSYFLITLLATNDPKRLKNYVKRKKRSYRIPKDQELKGKKFTPAKRQDFLRGLAKLDFEICYIVLNKKKVGSRLASREDLLFNYIAGQLLIPFITRIGGKITLTLDERTTHLRIGFAIQD